MQMLAGNNVYIPCCEHFYSLISAHQATLEKNRSKPDNVFSFFFLAQWESYFCLLSNCYRTSVHRKNSTSTLKATIFYGKVGANGEIVVRWCLRLRCFLATASSVLCGTSDYSGIAKPIVTLWIGGTKRQKCSICGRTPLKRQKDMNLDP